MRPRLLLALIVGLIVCSDTFQAAEGPAVRMLRVSLLEGDVTYQRTDLDRWVDLSINTPIFEGDKIWVGRGGRAEVEFENGGFARLSENTIVEFSRLSNTRNRGGVEVQLIQGLASFETRAEPAFTIQTPLFSGQLADAASFRVEVDTDGSGRLVVFDGNLEVSGQGSRLFVRRGELVRFLSQDSSRYYLETNYVKDEWDRWNEERNEYLTKMAKEQYHDGDRGWTTADLYNYGSWYDVPSYGRVWRPADVADDWVPFRSGRWMWCSPYGWTWVSYEPWGWIPYHYGRWANVGGYGWSWVPGPRYVSWCPGAVNWVQGTHWVGWVPLGPHEPWYGYGHGGNVFVSKNFRHRGSVTYLPHDSFVNGTPSRGFRSPRDPSDGRIIAGQPRVDPTPGSRMPVARNPTPRVFTNEDLEARRNMRERIVGLGRNSGAQNPSSEMERMRQERGRLESGATSGFANGGTQPTARGTRSIPTISAPGQTAPARLYDNWNNQGSTARSEQRQRIYRMDAPESREPSVQRQSPSTWARPTAPVLHPPVNPGAGPSTSIDDRSSARQRVYEVYRGRTDSGRTDRYSSPPLQQPPSSRYNPSYAPASPSAPMSHPAGPPASYNGPAGRPVGPPPGYPGTPSARESVSRSQSGSANSGTSNQESRGAVRGRTGR